MIGRAGVRSSHVSARAGAAMSDSGTANCPMQDAIPRALAMDDGEAADCDHIKIVRGFRRRFTEPSEPTGSRRTRPAMATPPA